MILKHFGSYQLALLYYRQCAALRLPAHLKDQLSRASSSVALNLAEGYGRSSPKDKCKFYTIAMGSLRESQAVCDLVGYENPELHDLGDHLGACLYKLIRTHGQRQTRL